jgi:hypothetical protein
MNEKVFLYEYATCGSMSRVSPSMAVEGLGMFKALLEGFEAKHEVSTFIDPSLPFFRRYPRGTFDPEAFTTHLEESEYCLLIAPETGLELHRLTRALEDSGCANLGSSSNAVFETTDKYLTYRRIKDLSPKTWLFKGGSTPPLPLVAKPRDGVSGEGVFLVETQEDFEMVPRGHLLQELVQGRAMSASLLVGDEVKLLSVNTQESENFRYRGARLPIGGVDTDLIYEAASRIKGLFGYVGVDFILGEELKIIEINPRPTTPIIALGYALGINIAELILKNYNRETLPDFKPRKRVWMMKLRGTYPDSYISHRGHSILIRDLNEDTDLRYRRSEH